MAEPAPLPTLPAEKAPSAPARTNGLIRGARETIESIAIAFALAFIFKTFHAEAFVIPTGSMAPTLMGRHKDVECPGCGYAYTANASDEADRDGNLKLMANGDLDEGSQVISCTCPICRFPMSVDPQDPAAVERNADLSHNGDRIWVGKFTSAAANPRRWDVVVFRYPFEAQTYFIKRLVGLPNEALRIYHGDIYTKAPAAGAFAIERKPPDKVRSMAQLVYDNDYVSPQLVEYGWPQRWQPWGPNDQARHWKPSADTRSFRHAAGAGESWIRYQHIVPTKSNWQDLYNGQLSRSQITPPQLITDFYAFNTRELRHERGTQPSTLGLHWVGDLMLECELNVPAKGGQAMLELVKAGRKFTCTFDMATGKTTLSISGLDKWQPTAATPIVWPGRHRVRFANFDQQLLLWVDDHLIQFDRPTTYEADWPDHPQAGVADADAVPSGGDLAPAGIGASDVELQVEHLRLWRDIYYIADDGNSHRSASGVISDYRGAGGMVPLLRSEDLCQFLSTPSRWRSKQGANLFDERQELVFDLGPDQFFVLGDNSPASHDARLWSGQHYVERDLLVGQALMVFWPHPTELGIPLTDRVIHWMPNFAKMGFIR